MPAQHGVRFHDQNGVAPCRRERAGENEHDSINRLDLGLLDAP